MRWTSIKLSVTVMDSVAHQHDTYRGPSRGRSSSLGRSHALGLIPRITHRLDYQAKYAFDYLITAHLLPHFPTHWFMALKLYKLCFVSSITATRIGVTAPYSAHPKATPSSLFYAHIRKIFHFCTRFLMIFVHTKQRRTPEFGCAVVYILTFMAERR